MSSSSCSSSSLVMLYCCSSTRAKYSMARMDSLSFRVRTMSWNGEKPTVQTPLDKHVSSQSADGRWSNVIAPLSFPLAGYTNWNTNIRLTDPLIYLLSHYDDCIQNISQLSSSALVTNQRLSLWITAHSPPHFEMFHNFLPQKQY